jgi:hypothetical protein
MHGWSSNLRFHSVVPCVQGEMNKSIDKAESSWVATNDSLWRRYHNKLMFQQTQGVKYDQIAQCANAA